MFNNYCIKHMKNSNNKLHNWQQKFITIIVKYSINVFHDGIPSVCGLRVHLSCHDRGDGDGVRHVRGDPCGHDDLRRSDACRGVRVCHSGLHDVRNDDDHPSCGVLLSSRGVRDGVRACGVCLRGDGRRGSGGPCGSDPYGVSCGSRRPFRLYRDVHGDHVFHPYGGDRAHDVHHGGHVHPNVSCVHRHVHDGDLHGGVCHDGPHRPCGGGDVPCGPCVLCRHVHGGDARGDGVHPRVRVCSQPRRGHPPRTRCTPPLHIALLTISPLS